MKVIGTGLSGLVGSRLVEMFAKNIKFVNFSIDTGVDILNIPDLTNHFIAHKDADCIIHFAAFTDTYTAWEQRGNKKGSCFQLNVVGTQNIVDLAHKYKKHLIYISTDSVFDGSKSTPYLETDSTHPIDWYGETKKQGEDVVTKLSSYTIARISYPYRAFFPAKLDIVRKILNGFQNNTLNPFFTDQIVTHTFIDDISKALFFLVSTKSRGVFHLTGSSPCSPYFLAQSIAKVFGLDSSIVKPALLDEYLSKQPPNSRPWQKHVAISNAKITSLGQTFHTLTEGLQILKSQLPPHYPGVLNHL